MKIISLVPVKNESWILPYTLPRLLRVSDKVIILDDGSSDGTADVAKKFKDVEVIKFESNERHVNMSSRRNFLLQEGRKAGGTHFVFLDADECFSAQASIILRDAILGMKRGHKLMLPWVNAWRDGQHFFYPVKDRNNYKDFIFCDDGQSVFENRFLSEGRTPGQNTGSNSVRVHFADAFVLHLQKLASARNQLKQAWYRCNELLEGSRSARRINATYNHTLVDFKKNKSSLDKENSEGLCEITIPDGKEYLIEITHMFRTHTALYFEKLDIWHIKELHSLFFQETGREPKAEVFPSWILRLNDAKNRAKMLYYKIMKLFSKK